MYTINKTYQAKQEIKKSEFICTLFPVNTLEDVALHLQETRKKYYDATHNCYAYILGDNGEVVKASDDGEPSQTAGVVILDALKKNDLTNVLAIVTRYFGGIKLGAGGLVRAYSSSTGDAISLAEKKKIEKCQIFMVEVSYQNYNLIDKYLKDYKEVSKDFTDKVKISVIMPVSEIEKLKAKLIEITKNDITITLGKEESRVL